MTALTKTTLTQPLPMFIRTGMLTLTRLYLLFFSLMRRRAADLTRVSRGNCSAKWPDDEEEEVERSKSTLLRPRVTRSALTGAICKDYEV